MTASTGSSTTRRFALLIGMLLHLLGAAAIPFHVWAPVDTAGAGAYVAERQDGGSSLPAHDELHCVLCHAAGTVAVPAPGAELPLAADVRRPDTPSARTAPTHRPAASARARAPPLG